MITITIRTKEQEQKMNPSLQDALSNLLKNPKREIPLVYQYLHNPNAELIIDSDNRIGTITNVRRSRDLDIIGDVSINSILKLASNFDGEVDNMMASYHQKTSRIEIDAFIIYNKMAKEEIQIKKKYQENRINSLSKSGEIPIMSHNGTDVMKEVSETLLKEYENMINEQNSNSEKED